MVIWATREEVNFPYPERVVRTVILFEFGYFAKKVGYAAVGGDLPLPWDLKTTSSMSLTQFLSGFVVPLGVF